MNIFFSFILPTILIILATAAFTFVMPLDADNASITILAAIYVLPGTATIIVVCLTSLSLPLLIIELKKTDFLKRTILYDFKTWKMILCLAFFYLLLSVISYFIAFFIGCGLICMIDDSNVAYVNYLITHANYGEIFYSVIIASLVGISIGLIIATVIKSAILCQIIGLIIVLLTMFLGGGAIPLQFISINSHDLLWNLTYVSPFHYCSMSLSESWCQGYVTNFYKHTSIFNPSVPFITNMVPPPPSFWEHEVLLTIFWNVSGKLHQFVFSTSMDKWLNLFIPYLFIIIFGGASLWFFEPTER